MKVKQIIIHDHDLKKLCALKGVSIRALARLTDINYDYLNRCANGKHILSEDKWNLIKKYL